MSIIEIEHNRVSWINIENPTKADIEALNQRYPSHHPLTLEDCLSRIERPKIDDYDDHLFLVMQFPVFDKKKRISRPAEVDIFMGRGYVVTVHDGILEPLNNLIATCLQQEAVRERYMGRGAGTLFYTILDKSVDYIFPILHNIDTQINHIEDELFEADTRNIVREISLIRRDIIALRRIIRPQISIISNLEQRDRDFIRDDLDEYFGDILDHMFKIRDIIEENYEIIADLSDTTNSLLSHRINEVMRVLTVISVIMLPLTLVSGIYGMNIPLPLAGNSWAFAGIMGLMVLIFLAMIIFFRHRRWL